MANGSLVQEGILKYKVEFSLENGILLMVQYNVLGDLQFKKTFLWIGFTKTGESKGGEMLSIELTYSVVESHIDLLFLEEFYSSNEFQNWFIANTIGVNKNINQVLRTEHSVFESGRESDLEITFGGDEGVTLFLIENKIDAQFQTNQAEDYKKRAIEYVKREICSESYTVLFAPEGYISTVKSKNLFDYYISFEHVISFFKSQTQLGNRAEYKIEILQRAIEKFSNKGKKASKGSSSYRPTKVNDKMTQFWRNYWNDLLVRIPELNMPKPEPKGPKASYIFLGKSQLRPNVVIKHKLSDGEVYLEFKNLKNVQSFIESHRHLLEEGMTLQTVGNVGKAVAFCIRVPEIYPYKFYDEIQAKVHQGQDAAKRLFDFYKSKIEEEIEFDW